MFKKTIAMLAAVLMCASLAACGDSDSSAGNNSTADTTTTTTASEADKESEADTTTTTTTTAAEESKPDESVEPSIKYDPEAKETVYELENPSTADWANPMGDYFFDGRSMPEGELTVTVELNLTEKTVEDKKESKQIAIAPAFSDSWEKVGGTAGLLTAEYPVGSELAEADGYSDGTYCLLESEETGKLSEDVYLVSDKETLADLYVKPDGFIKFSPKVWMEWTAEDTQTVTFTLSADAVKRMRETPNSGLLFQCSGGFAVNKVTFSAGNILTNAQYNDWLASGGVDGEWGK